MKNALGLLVVMISALLWADLWLGYEAAYRIGYGALTIMALLIAGTFFWLWAVRATHLALGMAFSWLGAASVMGWWWLYNVFGRPDLMTNNEVLFVFLATYFVGAVQHFTVVQRSFGLPVWAFAVPLTGATLVSVMIHVLA